MNYKVKLGSNGRIVIPASYRKSLDIQEGDELCFSLSSDQSEIRIGTLNNAVMKAQQTVTKYCYEDNKKISLVDELFQIRQKEINNEK